MCLSFLNSYVCRIVFLADLPTRYYIEQLSRRGTTLRSHHWSGLLSKDWQIIPLDYPRRRRPHNPYTAHRHAYIYVFYIYICTYTFAPVHTCAYRVRRWLRYTYTSAHTRKSICTRMRCETHSRAIADDRGAPRAASAHTCKTNRAAFRDTLNRARYTEGDDSEITRWPMYLILCKCRSITKWKYR